MTGPHPDLRALRERLDKLRRLHAEKTAVAEVAGELLSRERTFPRPRREVEEELRTAVEFDLPMLTNELGKTEREIAALERQLGPSAEAETEAVAARPQDEEARSRCAAIADALIALAKRAVYVRQLAASSATGGMDTDSLTFEGERAERGIAEIEAGLAGVERCVAATDLALRELMVQRAPYHDQAIAGDEMLEEA
jgi:hypothetical protein